MSYEDYGGIVYHYGRWAKIYGEGWVWVPGTTWAPAWVSWRSNDDYVGWAPLPPEATFRVGFGFGGWVDARFNIGPACFNFVGVRDFGAPALGAVILDRQQNVNIINNTRNITNITTNNTTIYNGGPSYTTIAARSSRPIPTLKLVRQGDPASIKAANGKILGRQSGNQLVMLAPRVTAPTGGKFPAPPHVAKTLTNSKADHGWDGVTDPAQRAQMQAKVKSDAPTYAPAKAVKAEDLKVVSDKIKAAPKPLATTTGEATPPVKTPKLKKTDTDLENAPAVEAATPKLKKAHPSEGETGLTGGATPKPRKKKTPLPGEESSQANSGELKPKPKRTPEFGDNVVPKPKIPAGAGEGPKVPKKKKPLPGETPGM